MDDEKAIVHRPSSIVPCTMRIAYFDCFAGVSGDMLLGALLDAGLSLDALRDELDKLPLDGYNIEARTAVRGELAGTYVSLHAPMLTISSNGHSPGQASAILAPGLIESISISTLSGEIKHKALAAVRLLVEAEAQLNKSSPPDTLPHGPADLNTLVEIVGTVAGLTLLEVERVECSTINVGGGCVESAQGIEPVPAPAIAEILRAASAPVYGTDANRHLVTPVGAAIIASIAATFGPMPPMKLHNLGYGTSAGEDNPGLMRVAIGDLVALPMFVPGKPQDRAHRPDEEWVTLIEANLDDMNPRYYDYVMDRLLGHGALDVFLAPVQMRGGRPGVALSVLCKPEEVDALAAIIFEETATVGLRISETPRRVLQWDMVQTHTRWGPIKAKVARGSGGRTLHVKPEYEDVKRLALEMNMPVDYVYEEARRAGSPYLLDGHQQMGRHREEIMK